MIFDELILGLIIVNIILTVVLLLIYSRNYRTISSKFTLGLVFFALAFLVENVLNLLFYGSLLAQGIDFITTYQFIINVLELAGLLILAWITWK